MLQLPPTRASSSQDVMISKPLVTSFSISSRASCPGRASLVAPRTRSITISRRRRLRHLSRSFAEATQVSSENSWNTAGHSSSNRNRTTALVSTSSRAACRDTNSTVASSTTPGSRIGFPRTKRPSKTVCWMSSERSPGTLEMQLVVPPERLVETKDMEPQPRKEMPWVVSKVWSWTSTPPLSSNRHLSTVQRQPIVPVQLLQRTSATWIGAASSKRMPNKCLTSEEVMKRPPRLAGKSHAWLTDWRAPPILTIESSWSVIGETINFLYFLQFPFKTKQKKRQKS